MLPYRPSQRGPYSTRGHQLRLQGARTVPVLEKQPPPLDSFRVTKTMAPRSLQPRLTTRAVSRLVGRMGGLEGLVKCSGFGSR